MGDPEIQTYTAFEGVKLLAHGELGDVVLKVKKKLREAPQASILVFSDSTGKQMDFDLSGSEKDVLQRLQIFVSSPKDETKIGPGRPKLGVVSREVSLLPRHWEWLSTQTAGASATLRRLIDEARKQSTGRERIKRSQERAYKFMSSLAGDLPQYEEALRALFSKDGRKFESCMAGWPRDVKAHAAKLAGDSFG